MCSRLAYSLRYRCCSNMQPHFSIHVSRCCYKNRLRSHRWAKGHKSALQEGRVSFSILPVLLTYPQPSSSGGKCPIVIVHTRRNWGSRIKWFIWTTEGWWQNQNRNSGSLSFQISSLSIAPCFSPEAQHGVCHYLCLELWVFTVWYTSIILLDQAGILELTGQANLPLVAGGSKWKKEAHE